MTPLPHATQAGVLAAKLSPPSGHPLQVPRVSIAARVLAAATVKLVLVRAPAGFGKTTTMLQARDRLEAAGVATAWLTLDRADNDVPRFLACLAAAVARPGLGASRDDVLDALARDEMPFTLFLDDLETIEDAAVMGLLREVIAHLPRRSQLVIGSRSLPDLGLGRLRARGQLLEIDAETLRFSLSETSAFFRLRHEAALPPDTLAQLHGKTEGWITALWLVAMARERHPATGDFAAFVDRFSGTDRAVADYLAEDVLAHQTPEVREFLLRTSILRQLDESVCRALMPRTDCARMLSQLESAHLFLTSTAGSRGARYHSLFADFLRSQLARELPGEAPRLHLAASGWYESQARPVPAIDHAIEGGDHPHALHLLAQHAETFLEQGRMRLLDRWFAAMPPERLRERPLLQVVAVWARCLTHGPSGAMAQLDALPLADNAEIAEQTGAAERADSADAAVHAHVNALRPLILAMMDKHNEALQAGRESLARLPTCRPFADGVLSNAMAHIVAVMGDTGEARRLLDEARRRQGRSPFNRMYTESMEGLLDLKEGRLRQATARLALAVSTTHQAPSYTNTHGNAWAGVLYASAVYEANDLDEAERLLNVYLPLARDVGLPDHLIASYRMRARIAFQRGDVDATFRWLTELEYLGHDRQLPRVVASAKLERSRVLLLQGNGQAARDELTRADDGFTWDRVRLQQLPAHEVDDLGLARLRWDLHFGDIAGTIRPIEAALDEATAAQRHHRALKLRLLLAIAQGRVADMSAAASNLDAVLRMACREGFVRLLLDEGPALTRLVQPAQSQTREEARADWAEDPIFAAWLQRLLSLLGPAPSDDAAVPSDSSLPEPLTLKELRVVQLLAEGYSNGAMAEKLFVSDSTVRTHLRNVSVKLDAHGRTQIVAIARRLRVIR